MNAMLLAWAPSSIGEWAIAIVVVAAIVALVAIALRKFNIRIPEWVAHVFWVLIVLVVVVSAIRFAMSI